MKTSLKNLSENMDKPAIVSKNELNRYCVTVKNLSFWSFIK
jgi:hypothetical protein